MLKAKLDQLITKQRDKLNNEVQLKIGEIFKKIEKTTSYESPVLKEDLDELNLLGIKFK